MADTNSTLVYYPENEANRPNTTFAMDSITASERVLTVGFVSYDQTATPILAQEKSTFKYSKLAQSPHRRLLANSKGLSFFKTQARRLTKVQQRHLEAPQFVSKRGSLGESGKRRYLKSQKNWLLRVAFVGLLVTFDATGWDLESVEIPETMIHSLVSVYLGALPVLELIE